jgi:two-component system NarL family response regulator
MSIRVLLADDHQMLRDGLRAVLALEDDVEVVGEANDGHSAVEMAGRLAPDVVLMDIGMSGLNGVDATRRIKAEHPNVNVIALSTYSDKRYVLSMLEVGASGYVLKAAAVDEMCRAVRAVAEGKRYLSPEVAGVVVDARFQAPAEPDAPLPSTLGPREREVLQLLAEGHSSPEIARRLHIAASTVETHRRNIMRKLNVHSVAELTKYAIREGLTSLDP